MTVEIVMGNEAIAYGLVESGCRVATAYPGTPSSEILAGVVKFKSRLDRQILTEWSTNEKVAFEVALAASWSGLRAAVAMKQVGLNVASDPLYSAAYQGTKGGFIVIPADDPGPHSSQTEQDSRQVGLNAKVPVFDPSSPAEARAMIESAFQLSEKYGLPVMLRPTTRLCHALQSISVDQPASPNNDAPAGRFKKDPARWAATPKFRARLHRELNNKLIEIEEQFQVSPLNYVVSDGLHERVGIIASGVAFNTAQQTLQELGLSLPILKIGTPYPLPRSLVSQFLDRFQSVIVLEEPGPCIEQQLPDRTKVRGRLDGSVPSAGELSPEVVGRVLAEQLEANGYEVDRPTEDRELQAMVDALPLPLRRPQLCPGCGHRSSFYAIRSEFGGRAIYPSDIGCYTLGINLRAVDTVVDMGAAVSLADGLHKAGQILGDQRPIIATIGDSTFLHSGIAPLINAVHTDSRFVLVILDNHITAMTGFQPTPANDFLADGQQASKRASIADLVAACGVESVTVTDPYDQQSMRQVLRAAYEHSQSPQGGVAVVIASRPCLLYDPSPLDHAPIPVEVTEECDGCRYCVEAFECPALVLLPDGSRVEIDEKLCVDCGQCIDACYKGFIVPVALPQREPLP